MKKFFAFAVAFICASTTLVACHDDDGDDEGDYVADYTSINAVSYIPGFQNATAYAGLNSYMLSDVNGYTDVYCFTTSSIDTTQAPFAPSTFSDGWQGGMCPTWFSATDEETYFTPACGEYHSGSGAVICNPGTVERAMFSKHFAVDFTALIAALRLKDIEGLYVCPIDAYNYLTTEEGRNALGVTNPTVPVKIKFVVYGYVDSFNFSSFSKLLNTLKNAASSIGSGGTKSNNEITLAEFDGKNWTVNKDWQYLDLSDIDDYYLFEGYLRVVDESGKSYSGFSIDEDNMLNYCLIDDITYEYK